MKVLTERLDKWDLRFFEMAKHIAEWSKDPSTKVGAVIYDSVFRLVSVGYNGFPRGVSDEKLRYDVKPTKYKLVVHSEANAILNARGSVESFTLLTTKFPCSECAKIIVQSGITRVVSPPPGDGEPWATDAQWSKLMFSEAGLFTTEIL